MTPPEGPAADGASAPAGLRPDFLRLLAHELRNHIAPIHNAAHLLRLKVRGDPGLTPVVEIIERQLAGIARALDAVGDTERLLRGELTLERGTVEVGAVLDGVRDAVQASLTARRQHLAMEVSTDLPPIEADAVRLGRALAALVDNASRYAPEGTRVALVARAGEGTVDIAIEDEGPGLPPAVRARPFAFFAVPHRAGQGLGLGLPNAAAVVRLHGGDITLEHPARGVRVVVHLPTAGAPAQATATASVRAATAAAARDVASATLPAGGTASGRRVLIADDSAAVRASLADLLREMGHEVRAAADGEEAVAMAQLWEPEFVLLDIHMPKLSGFEAARRLRARFPRPGMRLVMMSGDTLDENMRRGAAQAGFDYCIDKGLAIGELTGVLAQGGSAPGG